MPTPDASLGRLGWLSVVIKCNVVFFLLYCISLMENNTKTRTTFLCPNFIVFHFISFNCIVLYCTVIY